MPALIQSARAFSVSYRPAMNHFGSFGPDEAHALARLSPIVDAMLDAHVRGDYAVFSHHATPEFRERVTQKRFTRAHREIAPTLGALQSTRFVEATLHKANPLLRYAARYSESDADIQILVCFKDGTAPPAVDWMWIE